MQYDEDCGLGSPDPKKGLTRLHYQKPSVLGVHFSTTPGVCSFLSPETGQWKKTNGFSARLFFHAQEERRRSKRKSGSRGQRRKTECADVHNRIESEGRPSEDAISRLAALVRSHDEGWQAQQAPPLLHEQSNSNQESPGESACSNLTAKPDSLSPTHLI